MAGSWWQRIFGGGKKPPASAPADDYPRPRDELLEDVRAQVTRDVTAGFSTDDEILEAAVDVFDGEAEPALIRQVAQAALTEAVAAKINDQGGWPAETDCDRLDSAFSELEAAGVISRQNFSCCGTCGSGEIWDEVETAKQAGKPARAYAFYHMQDTEAAADGQGLYLNYGAEEGTEEAAVSAGHEIVHALNRHGLRTDWDGSIHRRIHVALDWKRRRAPEGPMP